MLKSTAEMPAEEEEDKFHQQNSRSSWACCEFKEFLMRSNLTLTRAHGKDNYFKYAERYKPCSRCWRDLLESRKYCDNPFDSHRPGKILRHSIVPVTGKLANFNRYPAFRHCSYVCVFCVYKAKKKYKQIKEDRRILDETKPKVDFPLRVTMQLTFFLFLFFWLFIGDGSELNGLQFYNASLSITVFFCMSEWSF